MNIEVEFYDLPNGEEPAKIFIQSLPAGMKAKMLKNIDMLEEYGPALRGPYSEHLEDGIFELRAKFGSDISRVLYFFIVDGKAILTHGFIKKQQKTPESEKQRAKNYRKEYLNRRK